MHDAAFTEFSYIFRVVLRYHHDGQDWSHVKVHLSFAIYSQLGNSKLQLYFHTSYQTYDAHRFLDFVCGDKRPVDETGPCRTVDVSDLTARMAFHLDFTRAPQTQWLDFKAILQAS